ncbi:hypothetical protein BG005_003730 [Podila minutissima]|nr:hypothetical protein BG005_003730 [Podila minutissima]
MTTPILSPHSDIRQDELHTLLAPLYTYHSDIEVGTWYRPVQAHNEFGNVVAIKAMRYDTDTERQQMEVEIEWHQRMGFSHIGSYMAKLEWSEAQLLGFVMSFQSMALVNATKLLRYVIKNATGPDIWIGRSKISALQDIRACLEKQQRELEEQQILQLQAMNIDEPEDRP